MHKKYITADETILYVRRIAAHLKADQVIPDCVIGPVRGGLIPGVMMSHILGIPFFPVSYSLRDHKAKEDAPRSLINFVNQSRNKTVLLIDDIVDTGDTFEGILNHLSEVLSGAAIVPSALIVNTEQPLQVRYTAKVIKRSEDNDWYEFFWEI